MKILLAVTIASTLALCACVKAPESDQPGTTSNDPVVDRIERDFPEDRFEYIRTPGRAPDVRLDRRTGCIYDARGQAILAGNGQPDCTYKSTPKG